jgi:hypothetical protein
MTRDEWIAVFAREAGVEPPSVGQVRDLLELAATAAHASERTVAPLACWVAARSDRSLGDLLDAADQIVAAGS